MSEYRLGFTATDRPLTYQLYSALMKNGVAQEDFDKGYHQINYAGVHCADKRAPSCVKGLGDRTIDGEEVFEYALTLAQQSEQYRRLVEGVLGRQLPWGLDDLRSKMQTTMTFLDGLLQRKGLAKGTPEYREAMAVGLFYLVAMPDKDLIAAKMSRFDELTQELVTLGWTEYKTFLQHNGGLRPQNTSPSQSERQDLTLTLLLFAACSMAGLPVAFMQGTANNTNDAKIKQQLTQENVYPLYHSIGISTAHGMRLMDPASFHSDTHYRDFVPVTPRQILSIAYMFHAVLARSSGNSDSGLRELTTASEIDPGSPWPYVGRIMLWTNGTDEKDWRKIRAECDVAIRIAPNLAHMYGIRGKIKAQEENFVGAIADLDEALRRDPSLTELYWARSQVHGLHGSWDKAVADFVKLSQFYPQQQERLTKSVLYVTVKKWTANAQMEALRSQVSGETGGVDPAHIERVIVLCRVMWANGNHRTSVDMLNDFLRGDLHGLKLSATVKQVMQKILAILPAEMRRDKTISAAMRALMR